MLREWGMHFKFRHLQKIVGGFFILSCVIIVVLFMIVARGKRWFEHYVHYTTHFADGGGIHAGTDVMIQGLQAGQVKGVRIEPDNSVRVDFGLFRRYAPGIREGGTVELAEPIVGSNRLEISLGPQDAPPIPHGGEIPSKSRTESDLDALIDQAARLVKKLDDPQGDLMQILTNVNRATKKLADSLAEKRGTLGLLVEDRRFYDELLSATTHLDKVLSTLDDSRPEIRDALTEARRGLEEANKVIRALQKSIFIRGGIEQYLKEDAALRAEGRAK